MGSCCEPTILTAVYQLGVAVAVLGVVHDHARGLHQGVADGRPDEGEPGFFQPFAHCQRLGRDGRHFGAVLEMVDDGFAVHERPKECHRVFQRQPGLGIAAGGLELETVANDPWVEHQLIDFRIAHLRHALYVEAVQHFPVALAFAQNGDPGQPGLEPFEQKQLEQTLRIAQRRAPLLIVISHVQRIF